MLTFLVQVLLVHTFHSITINVFYTQREKQWRYHQAMAVIIKQWRVIDGSMILFFLTFQFQVEYSFHPIHHSRSQVLQFDPRALYMLSSTWRLST